MTNVFTSKLDATKNLGKTANEAATNLSSTSKLVDLFGIIGTRNMDFTRSFTEAYTEDKELSLRILMWARDIRGGAGERETTRKILIHIENQYPTELKLLIPAWAEYGRWDDLLIFTTDYAKKLAFEEIKNQINAKNAIAAKWMPVQGKLAYELRTFMGWTPKRWRKTIVGLRTTVEQKMCAKDWTSINYSHVPSVASARYQKAFGRRDTVRYTEYLASLQKGVAGVKMNATAVYPYDVLKSMNHGNITASLEQWKALPDFLGDNMILPMVDVSGSMGGGYVVSKGVGLTPMDVALSIGMYTADKQKGAYHDIMLSFSETAELIKLTGANVYEKINAMRQAHWAMGTNLEAAFENVLEFAKTNTVPEADMPKMILVISDMEFNQCSKTPDATNYTSIKAKYAASGYKLPKIVFWNVSGRQGNQPVTVHDDNTALISGFSPAILKSVLADTLENFSPKSVMLETIMVDRYNIWE